MPKFLGPYKIVEDFGNSSFQIELPFHLKKRGIHNVFHASLLRIHHPNDDRLFPGRMDTQIMGEDPTDDELAVDSIRSHSGSKTDAVFEVHWKSGDVTWMPYYQITHLQALSDYLDLLKVTMISKLPNGHGWPPVDDPQVFLGLISPDSSEEATTSCLSIISPLPVLKRLYRSALSLLPSVFTTPSVSSTIDFETLNIMPKLRGIDHPGFTRISPTHYLMKDLEDKDLLPSTIVKMNKNGMT